MEAPITGTQARLSIAGGQKFSRYNEAVEQYSTRWDGFSLVLSLPARIDGVGATLLSFSTTIYFFNYDFPAQVLYHDSEWTTLPQLFFPWRILSVQQVSFTESLFLGWI